MTTGEIIQKLRLERGWSQEQLAERVGYSHKSSINKIEHSKCDLSRAKARIVRQRFSAWNCTPCWATPHLRWAMRTSRVSWKRRGRRTSW